ncbi:hypothetical protein D3C85_671550 [compost metagenome]
MVVYKLNVGLSISSRAGEGLQTDDSFTLSHCFSEKRHHRPLSASEFYFSIQRYKLSLMEG